MCCSSTCWQCYACMIGDVAFDCSGKAMNFCSGPLLNVNLNNV